MILPPQTQRLIPPPTTPYHKGAVLICRDEKTIGRMCYPMVLPALHYADFWTCEDRSRVLMQTVDGRFFCILFPEVPESEGK